MSVTAILCINFDPAVYPLQNNEISLIDECLVSRLSLGGLSEVLGRGGGALGSVVLLGLLDGDDVRELGSNTLATSGVMGKLDLDGDTEDTLLEEDVSDGVVNIVVDGVT